MWDRILVLWMHFSNGWLRFHIWYLKNLSPHILLRNCSEIPLMERSHCPLMLINTPVHDYEHTRCANCHGKLDFHMTAWLALPLISSWPLPFGLVWVLACGHLLDSACTYHLLHVSQRRWLVPYSPADPPHMVPISKTWKCPDIACLHTYHSIYSLGSHGFTIDPGSPHDLLPFPWGFQKLGHQWGPVTCIPLTTLEMGGKHIGHLLDLYDCIYARRSTQLLLRFIHFFAYFILSRHLGTTTQPALNWTTSMFPLNAWQPNDFHTTWHSLDRWILIFRTWTNSI